MIASSSDHYNFCAKYSQLSSIPSSPERRFKSTSPCRRLFEDVSTNQNQATSSPFVVSNGSNVPSNFLTTSIHNNNNNSNLFNNDQSQFEAVTKDGTANNNNNNNIVEGLTDILFSSYQRRRSINNQQFKINSDNNNCTFMDDLGFLSTNNAMVAMNNKNDFDSSIVEEENEAILMSNSPIKYLPKSSSLSKKFSSSIRKAQNQQVHWNRRSSITRRCMSVTTDNRISASPIISENGLIHHLPCFDSLHDAIKRISSDALIDLLEGKYAGACDRLLIIDCRYPYEYEGGHIPSAINVNNPSVMEQVLFDHVQGSTIIIFHCEFSSERAPRMALHVRNIDRELNKASYPSLFYPEMYILDGGYKNYWQRHGDKCEPSQAYLPMRNPEYRDQLRHHQRIKYAFKSGCHMSQHSTIKKLPPKSAKRPQERSKSLNIANARKFFNDLIESNASANALESDSSDRDLSFNSGDSSEKCSHMFPSYTIPMVNSFSSIFASEIDISSEMDTN